MNATFGEELAFLQPAHWAWSVAHIASIIYRIESFYAIGLSAPRFTFIPFILLRLFPDPRSPVPCERR